MSDDLHATAFHEAGHAAAAFLLGMRVSRVHLGREESAKHPGRFSDGRCIVDCPVFSGSSRLSRERFLIVLSAGPAAETYFTGRFAAGGAAFDVEDALLYARSLGDDPHDLLARSGERAMELITPKITWAGVRAIAAALLDQRELTGDEARQAFTAGRLSFLHVTTRRAWL